MLFLPWILNDNKPLGQFGDWPVEFLWILESCSKFVRVGCVFQVRPILVLVCNHSDHWDMHCCHCQCVAIWNPLLFSSTPQNFLSCPWRCWTICQLLCYGTARHEANTLGLHQSVHKNDWLWTCSLVSIVAIQKPHPSGSKFARRAANTTLRHSTYTAFDSKEWIFPSISRTMVSILAR